MWPDDPEQIEAWVYNEVSGLAENMCLGLGLVTKKIRKGPDLELESIEFVERLAMVALLLIF